MRANETERQDPVSQAKQKEIAHGCDLTVITESMPYIHHGPLIGTAYGQVFKGEIGRFDLLSVPSGKHLLKDPEWIDAVASDLLAALDLHKVEKALVATHSTQPRPLIQRLEERADLRGRVRIKGFTLPYPRPYEETRTLVISCMDWRLHGRHGLVDQLTGTFSLSRFGILATAGGGKDLGTECGRSRMVMAQLETLSRSLTRVIICSHTDCGKYGGDKAFAGADDQQERLVADLEASRARIRERFPRLQVQTAIALTKGGCCHGVVRPS